MKPNMQNLPRIVATRKLGSERFHVGGDPLGFDLIEFWSWSASDLISNATRGVLAEFLVAKALGLSSRAVRQEWDAYDFKTPGGIKIEVKSAALIQSWYQRDFSKIQFSVKPTIGWSAETNFQDKVAKRHADVYVLAFLFHRDQDTLDPMDLQQWGFFVLSKEFLDGRTRSQHSITLPTLRRLKIQRYGYGQLAEAVKLIAEKEFRRNETS